jgi:hypothetical protein
MARLLKSKDPLTLKDGTIAKAFHPLMFKPLLITKEDFCLMTYAGCLNDKGIFKLSSFGMNIDSIIPDGMNVLADSGYALKSRADESTLTKDPDSPQISKILNYF